MLSNPAALTLCLITDRRLCAGTGLARTVEAALMGGVSMVQVRDKDGTTEDRIAQARALKPLTRRFSVPLIVNDDAEAARAAGADGLHIGRHDMPAAAARWLIGPDMILGLSAGSEAALAAVAAMDPQIVDYVGIGPVFPTASKGDHNPAIGFDGLARLCALSPLPCIAIGGLKQNHGRQAREAGARGMAVISAICGTPDPQAAARALITGMEIGTDPEQGTGQESA